MPSALIVFEMCQHFDSVLCTKQNMISMNNGIFDIAIEKVSPVFAIVYL